MSKTITGHCLCGQCSYSSNAEPINIRACHCEQCQRATGSALYARIALPLDQVTMAGPVRWYNSSAELARGFCSECGSTLYSKRESANILGVTCGTLDDPTLCTPDMQIWASEKQDWMPLGDLEAHAQGPDSPLMG